MTILFASTNEDKLRRLRLITSNFSNLQFISLKEVGLSNLQEPEETGQNELENAQIKAQYYFDNLKNNQKMPVLAQDDGIYTPDIDDDYKAGKNIKATVKRHMGNNTQVDIHNYWRMLANKYPSTPMNCLWAFALINGEQKLSSTAIIPGVLDASRQLGNDQTNTGSPISSLFLVDINNDKKFTSDLTNADYQILSDKYCGELEKMLKEIETNQKY
jgi:Ham1 family